MPGGAISGLGRGLQNAAQLWLAMDEQERQRKRQSEQDALQQQLIQSQLTGAQAQIENQKQDNLRADRAEERAAQGDMRDQVKEFLMGLEGPTNVDEATRKRIMDAGLGAFLQQEELPVPGFMGGAPMGLTVPGGVQAKPYETAATRLARQQLAESQSQHAEQRRQFDVTEQRLRSRDEELDSYRESQIGLRQQLAQAQLERALAANDNNLVARKADLLQILARTTGALADPTVLPDEKAALQGIVDLVREELTKLSPQPVRPRTAEENKQRVLPTHLQTGPTGPQADAKVAAFGAAVRNRR